MASAKRGVPSWLPGATLLSITSLVSVIFLLFLVWLVAPFVPRTFNVSTLPEYKSWIGQTVPIVGAKEYRIFAPKSRDAFLSTAHGHNSYPIIAEIPLGYPVTIESVRRTEGKYAIGNQKYTHDQLVLSIEIPREVNKRINALSEIDYVLPFEHMVGYHIEGRPSIKPLKESKRVSK